METKYENTICIVNSGFSDEVMNAARSAGAFGGTVFNARGTASKESEKTFDIVIHPEKEMVMILVPVEIKEKVMHALYQKVGLDTPGQGIAFSLPVEDVVGLNQPTKKASKGTDGAKSEKK